MHFKEVTVVQSSEGGGLLETPAPSVFERDPAAENLVINLYPGVTYQEIIGFGGAFTETSAYQFSRMSAETQDAIIKAYFDPAQGLGYNFCRTHIHSCDFSCSRYTYVEDEDRELRTFSIARDRKYLFPFIKAARNCAGDGRAQIVVNPEKDEIYLEPTYYAIGHFSRFVKRGAKRIGTSSFTPNIAVTAFKNPDGGLAAVVLNRGGGTLKPRLRMEEITAPVELPGHSLTTFVIPA
jgi:O-glycosyl hydrolase